MLQDPIEAYSMRLNRNYEQNNARKAEEDTSIDPSMYDGVNVQDPTDEEDNPNDDVDIGQAPVPADDVDIGQAPIPADDVDIGQAPIPVDDKDSYKRLQKKRKYTTTRTYDLRGLEKMKRNRAKWFNDEPYDY